MAARQSPSAAFAGAAARPPLAHGAADAPPEEVLQVRFVLETAARRDLGNGFSRVPQQPFGLLQPPVADYLVDRAAQNFPEAQIDETPRDAEVRGQLLRADVPAGVGVDPLDRALLDGLSGRIARP